MKIKLVLITAHFLFGIGVAFSQNELKTYNDSLGFYTFTYPANFEINKLAPVTVKITSALDSQYDKFRENLTIAVNKSPEGLALDSLSSLLHRSLVVKYFTLRDRRYEMVTIGGYEGRKISATVMEGQQLISISESFTVIKGLIIRLSYINEFQPNSNEIYSFKELIQSLKTNW
jgi:hypothetical protein